MRGLPTHPIDLRSLVPRPPTDPPNLRSRLRLLPLLQTPLRPLLKSRVAPVPEVMLQLPPPSPHHLARKYPPKDI